MHHESASEAKIRKKWMPLCILLSFQDLFLGKTIEALQIYRINQFKQMIETLQSKTTKRTP